MESSGQVLSSIAHQLYSYNSEIDFIAADENTSFSDEYLNIFHDLAKNYKIESENSDEDDNNDSLQILRGFMEKLDVKRRKMLEKFISKVENDGSIEKIFREISHHDSNIMFEKILRKFIKVDGNIDDQVTMDRGISDDEIRLERFKVKTVNVIGSGVVKEEQEKR